MYSVSRQISDVKRQMKTTTINLREPLAEQNLEAHEARNWRAATIIGLWFSPISRVAERTSEFSELTKRLNHCVHLKSEAVREKHKNGSRILNHENEGGKILTIRTNTICGYSHKTIQIWKDAIWQDAEEGTAGGMRNRKRRRNKNLKMQIKWGCWNSVISIYHRKLRRSVQDSFLSFYSSNH